MMTANSANPATAKRLIHTGSDRFGWTSLPSDGSQPAAITSYPQGCSQDETGVRHMPPPGLHTGYVANASIQSAMTESGGSERIRPKHAERMRLPKAM